MSSISQLTSTSIAALLQQQSSTTPTDGPQKTNKAVADLLGMDADSLKQALQSGQNMSQLAAKAGVSQSDLVSTVQATLPAQGPDGVSSETMANNIVNGTPHAGHHRPTQGVDASQGLDQLSSSLGISSDDLLSRLSNGTGISDLLDANPDVAASLSSQQNKGALMDGYA